MRNLILLTTALLYSVGVYASTCTLKNPLKCDCAYPVLKNVFLACGDSYCGNKKCMPKGACCEEDKYCKVGDTISCCAENETCDTIKGCVPACNIENCLECEDGNDVCKVCADGYILMGGKCYQQCNGGVYVDNYTDDIGKNGKVCCAIKTDQNDIGWKNYQIAGAVNGLCCAEYQTRGQFCKYTLEVMNNNGGYYCAEIGGCPVSENSYYRIWFENSGKVCNEAQNYPMDGDSYPATCNCSDKGDPRGKTTCSL